MIKPSELTWDEVVRVGAGTPGGNYLRSYWWPVALADEVKDIPLPVKVLGEELVLFRDLSGYLTLLGAFCSHRRAALEYGIIQADGIRCAYHGWCYDRRGNIVDRPAEPIKTAPNIHHPCYPARELGGFVFAYLGKNTPPPLPRYDVLVQDGHRVVERGDAEAGKAYHCNWLQGVENTTDTTHLTYLHNIYKNCPAFKPVEGDYGVKLYILEPRAKPAHVAIRKRCTVLPTINRKSRELKPNNPGEKGVTLQQAIWVIPIDDTHCEEMRITVYPEAPAEQSYHGGYVKQAKLRERQPYDRRFYGEIRGNVPLEDKAMVESQGAIVDRTLEHPGYGDRAILLLRKMIRDGIAAVANGAKAKGVLTEDLAVVDLDIGVDEYPVNEVPPEVKALLTELQQQAEQL
jgi:phenylpropionate dioxygenase-like ring-hydroxylating dioxygenase large terminal subunit